MSSNCLVTKSAVTPSLDFRFQVLEIIEDVAESPSFPSEQVLLGDAAVLEREVGSVPITGPYLLQTTNNGKIWRVCKEDDQAGAQAPFSRYDLPG